VLERVAQEERTLLAEVASARSEAQNTIETAQAEARKILEDSDAALARELAELRRAAERDAALDRKTIHDTAEAKLARAQAQAQAHARHVVEDVLHQILPDGRAEAP
jgi:vacuolar-type H+-ATPase subunit H